MRVSVDRDRIGRPDSISTETTRLLVRFSRSPLLRAAIVVNVSKVTWYGWDMSVQTITTVVCFPRDGQL